MRETCKSHRTTKEMRSRLDCRDICVGAGNYLRMRRVFARISPNLPEKVLGRKSFLCEIFLRLYFGWPLKRSPCDVGRHFFYQIKAGWAPFFQIKVGYHLFQIEKLWAPFLLVFSRSLPRFFWILWRFSQVLPRFPQILPGFSINQNFWGCACTPASYTTDRHQIKECDTMRLDWGHSVSWDGVNNFE